jgi:FtsP/CotA-like multicopper oxidase with cupredoxin domain
MNRRRFLLVSGAAVAALAAPAILSRRATAAEPGAPLPIPQILDAGPGAGNTLNALSGSRDFVPGVPSPTLGYEGDYLGPTLRMRRGSEARLAVSNRTGEAITTHWHGMHIPGDLDGGPQLLFGEGETWAPTLPVDQPAATLWYHSHVHGHTADQVYRGLAGLIIVDDPDIADPLPRDYGVNDIPLVVQDRSFSGGRMVYDLGMMGRMQGFHGNEVLVNGVVRPLAAVPAGLVRLRLLNGSNARVYDFYFEDGRQFHRVASDGGLLPAPLPATALSLAPGERAEIVADFSDGRAVRLMSADTGGMMGMMGGGMMGGGGRRGGLHVMTFEGSAPAGDGPTALPARLPAQIPDLGQPQRQRDFVLNMGAGGMMGMMGGMFGGGGGMGINGRSYDMGRIDQQVPLGQTELWRINADMMTHPFHVHGTSFLVLRQNGRSVDPMRMGLKDVIHVGGPTEILVRFDKPASAQTPYMFHCHILEHEDSGMMGQFTVG